ncbi:MAG: fused MFS/spermidine synthase, partial [Proteobacteria bacterium]|nr:fused MFS/spermidine synthase [Pseudomonadota bacterium]
MIIYILFLGSGLTGLIYQVLWTRLLTLTFGVTTLAISTVLTCFFGGLALGSFLGGRWVDKRGRGFKWYGYAEIIIGIYALLFLWILGLNNDVYVLIARGMNLGFYGQNIIKFVLSIIILIIPATMMGATLPILSKELAGKWSSFAKDIGNLYTVNTVGAVAGAVLTAYLLIPSFGIKAIIITVGLINIAIGVVALLVDRAAAPGKDDALGSELLEGTHIMSSVVTGVGEMVPARFSTIILFGFALSGFTALAYEVIWSRVLTLILTGTIFAFAAVLAVFLTGIAVGSFVVSRYIDRVKNFSIVINTLAVVEILIGVSSIAIIILYSKMPEFSFYGSITGARDWGEYVYVNFLISFLVLFVPTFLFGTTFPLVCKIYNSRMDHVGESIGNVYSINTVGGIIGSFMGGFVLIQFFGMQTSMVLMGVINVLIGIVFLLTNPFGKKKTGYVLSSLGAALVVFVILILPDNMPRAIHESYIMEGEKILFYEEGPAATVMIAHRPGRSLVFSDTRLWVNGNLATAAYYEGLQINRFQGALPMVLHPDPKDILVICFGTGTTFGTLSQFDVDGVDNVEIARTVTHGAPFFKSENSDVLNNPKSNIIIDDGRSYLEVTNKKYDVITEEPMHPALVGVVNLYTVEYYELAKSHLKEGGIMSQWIPLYALSVDDLKMLTATFQSVFEHTTIWIANADIFLIGSSEKQSVNYDRIKERLAKPNIKRIMGEIDLEDPIEFVSTFLMNEDAVREYASGAPLVTDNMPLVEFTGPRSLSVNTIS